MSDLIRREDAIETLHNHYEVRSKDGERMIKMACREKHIYAYSPAESIEVRDTANDLKRLYEMQDYDTRLDISTVTITVTATRIIGVEGESET